MRTKPGAKAKLSPPIHALRRRVLSPVSNATRSLSTPPYPRGAKGLALAFSGRIYRPRRMMLAHNELVPSGQEPRVYFGEVQGAIESVGGFLYIGIGTKSSIHWPASS